MIWLLPLSIPSVKSTPATHRKTEKESKLADKRRGGEGERGAKSYDGKNARFSINHSILSEYTAAFCR
jgi:hypothetical protein